MFGKRKMPDWLFNAKKAYRKRKLPRPYSTLYEYYKSNVITGYEDRYEGHFSYLYDAKSGGYLDIVVTDLRSILTGGALDNFNGALEGFYSLGDDPDYDDVEKVMDKFDIDIDDYEDEIESILSKYVTEMADKKLI